MRVKKVGHANFRVRFPCLAAGRFGQGMWKPSSETPINWVCTGVIVMTAGGRSKAEVAAFLFPTRGDFG